MSGQMSKNTVLTELSGLLAKPVDTGSTERARRHLLDWMGCAIAGASEPVGVILRQARGEGASAQAFYWGGLGNILEMDDVDKRALLHPGPSIIPAALALASVTQPDDEMLLNAIVLGYEATIRLGRAVGSGHYAIWHNTGTCGTIGAAVACAALLNASEVQTSHAMALAMSQASGLWQTRHDPQSMGKQLHTANAARAGFEAARLAVAGFKGPLDILEGEQGFFKATCTDGDARNVLRDYASNWLIHDVSFKPWPACRHAHAAIDAALVLRGQVDLSDGAPILVETYSDALKFCDRPDPRTVIEGKFSLQHAVAVALRCGAPSLDDFNPSALADPNLAALRERVQVAVSDEFSAVYPDHFGASVRIGGHQVKTPDALGDPENPVNDDLIKEKALMLMQAGGVSQGRTAEMIGSVLSETGTLMTSLRALEEVLS